MDEGLVRAREAAAAGRRALEATRRKTPEIRALGQLLRELRQEDGFAERVARMGTPPQNGGASHG